MSRLFTSESVTEGHPDKVADAISDAVLDELLRQDPTSRVAVETLVTTGMVVVAGEVTTEAYADVAQLARKGCQLLVLNDVSGGAVFGAPDNQVLLLGPEGVLGRVAGTKTTVAHAILDAAITATEGKPA